MIARNEDPEARSDIWARLAAPLPESVKEWRQDGRPVARDGKFFARFVVYIEANTVRERLDSVVPGEWDLTLELLPALPQSDMDDVACSFKARLAILGTIREDVGHGKDYKQAATDAFKRAAVRFGIGHELYSYEQNWVPVDGDGKYAKPLEDPGQVYARKHGGGVKSAGAASPDIPVRQNERQPAGDSSNPAGSSAASSRQQPAPSPAPSSIDERAPLDDPYCPKCGGTCFDNRAENDARAARGEKLRPDWKCKNRTCDGVIWRPKGAPAARTSARAVRDDEPPPPDDNDLPF